MLNWKRDGMARSCRLCARLSMRHPDAMSEQDDALREMARHRGLKLVKSRRRKPGGDFGKYGLTDARGGAAFGVDGKAVTASAEEVEAYLRKAMRADWAGSTKGLKPLPKPKPAPKPKPVPKFKPKLTNLFEKLPAARRAEAFTELLSRPGVRIERIVSRGQATPAAAPMSQDRDEWVVLLAGSAAIRLDTSEEIELKPGDYLIIAAGQQHWVTRTSVDEPALWLAVHF